MRSTTLKYKIIKHDQFQFQHTQGQGHCPNIQNEEYADEARGFMFCSNFGPLLNQQN